MYHKFLYGNLKRGITEGYYREDINITESIDFYNRIRKQIYVEFSDFERLKQSEHSALLYHLHAICTPKGLLLLKGILK